jgi:hypothetical protein
MKTILFHENQLGYRGTSVAVYDYAFYNQTILGNKSIVCVPANTSDLASLDKFRAICPVYIYQNLKELYSIPHDIFYAMKYGFNDEIINPYKKSCVHVVFPSCDPHGNVYAYISEWLRDNYGQKYKYVPYIVNLPDHNLNLKSQLNIEESSIIFGWYGGNNFEIPFARQAVIDIASSRTDITFLFMNQEPFCELNNILFLRPNIDNNFKTAFINTCDVMIHARERGETFGLAIGEFSSKNKPIITYYNSPERCHIDILGDKGLYYNNYDSLYNILNKLNKKDINSTNWNCYQNYNPETIINQFKEVFIYG